MGLVGCPVPVHLPGPVVDEVEGPPGRPAAHGQPGGPVDQGDRAGAAGGLCVQCVRAGPYGGGPATIVRAVQPSGAHLCGPMA